MQQNINVINVSQKIQRSQSHLIILCNKKNWMYWLKFLSCNNWKPRVVKKWLKIENKHPPWNEGVLYVCYKINCIALLIYNTVLAYEVQIQKLWGIKEYTQLWTWSEENRTKFFLKKCLGCVLPLLLWKIEFSSL